MKKKLVSFLTILLFPLLIITGYSSWIIVGEKIATVGTNGLGPTGGKVAYISSDPSKFYTRIEKALEVATDGQTVYVLPNSNPTIYEDCEIKSGVILCLPYDGTTYKHSDKDYTSGKLFSDTDSTYVKNNRKNSVKVNDNVVITNNGTLYIGGQLGTGSNGRTPTGHTAGLYCEMVMGENSSIINNGTIDCFGYIKESKSINGSSVISNSGSNVILPLVIYDFRGGSFSSIAATKTDNGKQKIMPFNVFDFPNIQSKMIYNYGSKLQGRVMVYANSTINIPEPTNVIYTSNAMFLIKSGSVSVKYTPATNLYTANDCSSATAKENINKSKVYLDGDISISSLKLSLGMSIDTADFHLPLSYKFDVIISSGISNIDEKVKFLGGSSLIVNENSILNINASTYFYRNYIEKATTDGAKYPKIFQTKSTFINNGTVNINSPFAGQIETNLEEGKTAKLVLLSSFSPTISIDEMISGTGNGITEKQNWSYCTVTGNAVGFINSSTLSSFKKDSTYTSKGILWEGAIGTTATTETYGATKTGSCLLPGTMITMADGTKKPVEQIQPGDMLKVFNHYTGEYDVSPVVFNDSEPKQDVIVINLEFSNGSYIGVVAEHGFFDLDLMKYVYIDEYNYNDYVGHRFYSDGNSIVTLNRAYITTQYTEVYSPVTAYHLNYFTEDILSMPGGIEGLFNIFEYDDNLKYNEELMKQDIEKYGLYTYDDFKDYCSYEFYQAFPAEYLKVAVGKGYITFDEIIYLINRYKTKV